MHVDPRVCTAADVKDATVCRMPGVRAETLVLHAREGTVLLGDAKTLAEMGIADGSEIRVRVFPNGHVLAQFPCGRTIVLYTDAEDGEPLVTTAQLAVCMQQRTRIPPEEQEWVCMKTGVCVSVTADPPESLASYGIAQHGTRMIFAPTGKDVVEVRTWHRWCSDSPVWVRFDRDTTLEDLYSRARIAERTPYIGACSADFVLKIDGDAFARYTDHMSTSELAQTLEELGVCCGALISVTHVPHVDVDVLAPELGLCERIDTAVDATLREVKERAGVDVPCVVSLFNTKFVCGDDNITIEDIAMLRDAPRPFPLHVHLVPESGLFVILQRESMPFMRAVVPYTSATTVGELCEEAARISGGDARSVRFTCSGDSRVMSCDARTALRCAACSDDDDARARTLVDIGVVAGAEIVFW